MKTHRGLILFQSCSLRNILPTCPLRGLALFPAGACKRFFRCCADSSKLSFEDANWTCSNSSVLHWNQLSWNLCCHSFPLCHSSLPFLTSSPHFLSPSINSKAGQRSLHWPPNESQETQAPIVDFSPPAFCWWTILWRLKVSFILPGIVLPETQMQLWVQSTIRYKTEVWDQVLTFHRYFTYFMQQIHGLVYPAFSLLLRGSRWLFPGTNFDTCVPLKIPWD